MTTLPFCSAFCLLLGVLAAPAAAQSVPPAPPAAPTLRATFPVAADGASFAIGAVRGPLQSTIGATLGFGGLFAGGAWPVFRHGIVQFPNSPIMRRGGGAITFGHFELYAGWAGQTRQYGPLGPNSPINDGTGWKTAQDHEDAHVVQSDMLGWMYLPAHLLSMAVGVLTAPPGTSLGAAVHGPNAFMETGPMQNPPVPFGSWDVPPKR